MQSKINWFGKELYTCRCANDNSAVIISTLVDCVPDLFDPLPQ